MLKQLLITLPSYSGELEVIDFLSASRHTPQWLGPCKNWEIKSFSVKEGNPDKITALLENNDWNIHEPLFFEVKDLKAILKENPPLWKIYFVCQKGINGKEEKTLMGPKISVEDLKWENENFAVVNYSGDNYYSNGDELLYNAFFADDENKHSEDIYLAVRIDKNIFPVCGHYTEDNNLFLIYNQDVKLYAD